MDISSLSIYEPLDIESYEIRMLTLLPDSEDSVVRCTLEKTSLLSPAKYSALSYCWGDQNVTTNIIVNNVEYPVTTNLADALQQLRLLNVPRVWVDALCINQHDRQEKSLQIRNMRHVYSRAETTYAWIGNSELDMSAAAISFLKNVIVEKDFTHIAKPIRDDPDAGRNQQHHLLDLLRRQYWTRRWIIQELAVSSSIQILCGGEAIALDDLDSALMLCQGSDWWSAETEFLLHDHLQILIETRSQYKRKKVSALWKLLDRTKRFESTDSRDIIYALIGISSDGHDMVPWPNYQQSPETITMNFTRALISSYKYLDLILIDRIDKTISLDLPSWSPNWLSDNRLPYKLQTENQLLSVKPKYANASMYDGPLGEGNILLAEGVVIDTIMDLTSTLEHKRPDEKKVLQVTKRAISPELPSPTYYDTPLKYQLALLTCLLYGLTSGKDTPQVHSGLACSYLLNNLVESSPMVYNTGQNHEEDGQNPEVSSREAISQWIQANPEFLLNGRKLEKWFLLPKGKIINCLVRMYGSNKWFLFYALSHLPLPILTIGILLMWNIKTDILPTTAVLSLVIIFILLSILGWYLTYRYLYNQELKDRFRFRRVQGILAQDTKNHFQIPQKLVVTEKGILGMACPKAQAGDKICYVAGCTSAVVLRGVRRSGGGQEIHYQVVGRVVLCMTERDRKTYPGFAEDDFRDGFWNGGARDDAWNGGLGRFQWKRFQKKGWFESSRAWSEVLEEYKRDGRWLVFCLV